MSYKLTYGFLYCVSLLPAFLLYGFGDIVAFLVFYVFGYRRQVVMENLAIAFPEKSIAERRKIAAKFYKNLIESFIETILLLSASEKRLQKMFAGNINLLNELTAEGYNVQVHTLHQFNWEVLNLVGSKLLHAPFLVVYMPITNKSLDRVFRKIRTRNGTQLISAKKFKTDFIRRDEHRHILALVADQSPGSPKNAYWTHLFGKPTAFVTGPEKGAILTGSAVVFAALIRVKRGLYAAELKLVTKDATGMEKGEITIKYARFIEESIRNTPDNYLWSHRRWKFPYKPEYAASALEPMESGNSQ